LSVLFDFLLFKDILGIFEPYDYSLSSERSNYILIFGFQRTISRIHQSLKTK